MVELGAHQALPRRLEAPPLAEGLHQACRGRRVCLVEGDDLVGEKRISLAAPRVEMQLVALREGADQGAYPVRVAAVEGRVLRQGAHRVERARERRTGLQGEPFVDDERIGFPAAIEGGERL